jgi:uncharacterized membrane protein YfcA
MLLGYPLGELALLALLIAGAGILVGVLAGLFGIGGGAIIVPVLYEVFRILDVPEEVRIQICIGTSLAIIVPTTVRSYLGHKNKGAVIPEVVRVWTLPAIIGVAVGSTTASFAPAPVFKIAFLFFVTFIAVRMLFGGERWKLGDQLPGRRLLAIYGFILAIFISGRRERGAISNAVLTLYGRPMHQAVGTSAGLGAYHDCRCDRLHVAGWPYMAQLPPFSIWFVSLIAFVLMAPVSSYTTIYGVRLAHWLPRRKLEIAFGIFLLLVALRFALSMI